MMIRDIINHACLRLALPLDSDQVMTMPRFAHKRVGYLAANQCFTEDTEVVLLCTNHLQKEFKSQNPV